MDTVLRCNDLQCRIFCPEEAVVTTCSHIFCLNCAERLGLNVSKEQRVCPACATVLPGDEDAAIAKLDPTEDYKTSILSGLNPTLIMECAGRALSFWHYQMVQEIMYQQFLGKKTTKNAKEEYAKYENKIRVCKDDMAAVQAKLEATLAEKKAIEERYHKLGRQFKEKAKAHSVVDRLYRGLKQQQLAAGVELAAEHNAEDALHDVVGSQYGNHLQSQMQHPIQRGNSDGSGGGVEQHRSRQEHTYPLAYTHGPPPQGSRAGLTSARSWPVNQSQQTSTTRQRMPLQPATYGAYNHTLFNVVGNDVLRKGTPMRGSGCENSYVHGHSPQGQYGTGIRAGRPQAIPQSRAGQNGVRVPGMGMAGLHQR